ncbi:DsbA family protein [Arthrobacter halodurans]|uniref:DsbA family protein n=1 Tax=Arthrobacter halodurans TaxID=516699 RepID=A0ABV4UQ61_9MICC
MNQDESTPDNGRAAPRTEAAPTPVGPAPARRKMPWFWILPIPVALVVGLLIGAQLPVGERSPAETQAPAAATAAPGAAAPQPDIPDVSRLDPQDGTAIGSVDAPVVMVAFTDFQCPFCAKWTDATLPDLVTEYVDSGRLRIEWRDLDLFGEASLTGAHAAQAAALQGGYVDFHHRMAEGGKISPNADFGDENLRAVATELGMDGEKLIADMDSPAVKDAVRRNIEEAESLGIMSTPVFLINTTPFVCAQPLANFEAAIDAELYRAGAERP